MAGLPPYPPQGTPNPYGFTNDPNAQQPGIPQMPPVQMAQPQQGNGIGVAGMVLGIISIVLFWVPILDGILAILAVALSAAGMSKANKIGGKGKGMAIAGLVTGLIGVLLTIVFVVMMVQAMHHARDYSYSHYNY